MQILDVFKTYIGIYEYSGSLLPSFPSLFSLPEYWQCFKPIFYQNILVKINLINAEFKGLPTEYSVIPKAKLFTKRFFFFLWEENKHGKRLTLGKVTLDAHWISIFSS